MGGLRLHVLDTGSMTFAREGVIVGGGLDLVTVPVPSFLIDHPDGVVVYEGGIPIERVTNPHHWTGLDGYTVNMTAEHHVTNRVRELGIDPADVRYVVQSHLHMDHTGAIGHFPNAEYVVHREELAYSNTPLWCNVVGYQVQDIHRPGTSWKMLELTDEAPVHDLFGDGAIRLIFSPGHAVGLLSMIVALESGSVMLTSDAANSELHWNNQAMPWFLDAFATVRSVERLHRYRDAFGIELVIFGHDAEQWPSLKKGTDSYA